VEEYRGQIKQMAMNQSRYVDKLDFLLKLPSCRYLQKQLASKDPKIMQTIFSEVIDDIAELITHPFGNYLCQILLEKCSPRQRRMVIDKCHQELAEMSCNVYGSRPVQKLIENLGARSEDIQIVINALKVS
jgi:hypothetical protein